MRHRTGQIIRPLGVIRDLHDSVHAVTDNFQEGVPQASSDVGNDTSLLWILAGTGATALTAATHDPGGGIDMLTGGTDNNGCIIFPHDDAEQSVLVQGFNSSNEPAFCATIETGAAITTTLIHVGFKLTIASLDETTDDDQVMFTFDTDTTDTKWMCNYSYGGTDVELDSGHAVAVSTRYVLGIQVDSDRMPHFFINDKEVAVGTVAMTASIALKPFVGVQCLAGSARRIYCRRVSVARAY